MFKKVLKHWDSDDFSQYFKYAFNTLKLEDLPLFQHCTHSGVIDEDSVEVRVLSRSMDEQIAHLTIGVFFCEVLSGCACSDDPSQAMMLENSYCELRMDIDCTSAQIEFLD